MTHIHTHFTETPDGGPIYAGALYKNDNGYYLLNTRSGAQVTFNKERGILNGSYCWQHADTQDRAKAHLWNLAIAIADKMLEDDDDYSDAINAIVF